MCLLYRGVRNLAFLNTLFSYTVVRQNGKNKMDVLTTAVGFYLAIATIVYILFLVAFHKNYFKPQDYLGAFLASLAWPLILYAYIKELSGDRW